VEIICFLMRVTALDERHHLRNALIVLVSARVLERRRRGSVFARGAKPPGP
jgi:hypothetical protein